MSSEAFQLPESSRVGDPGTSCEGFEKPCPGTVPGAATITVAVVFS